MGCGSCGTGGSTGGCNNGCSSGGCNKLNSFDWLNNMLPPYLSETDNVYEVRFKNTRKEFFRNVNGLRLNIGDWVVVEGDRGGFDIGEISMGGVLAKLQFSKKSLSNPTISKLYRKAGESDMEMLRNMRTKEPNTVKRSRNIIKSLRLDMKLSDVEYQGDGTKATFFYIADSRVDFRELIKLLAKEFKIRVEMKQIGLRHEAALLGGIGVCGRVLCCSTWLTEFKVVTTSAARYQNLSLNPAKISGLCGRLKCCLNYELDTYKDALKDFPDIEKLNTERGMVYLQKTDIFKYKMWFSYEGETTWYPLDVADVKKYAGMNRKGQKAPTLSNEVIDESGNDIKDVGFVNVVAQHDPEAEKRAVRKEREKEKEKQKKRSKQVPRNQNANPNNQNQNPNNENSNNENPNPKQIRSQNPNNENSNNENPNPKQIRRPKQSPNPNPNPEQGEPKILIPRTLKLKSAETGTENPELLKKKKKKRNRNPGENRNNPNRQTPPQN